MQFFRQRFQTRRDFRDFLHAVVTLARGAGEKLNIVDHQHIQPALALQAPRPRCELRDGKAAGLVDVKGQRLQLARHIGNFHELVFAYIAAADA